MIEDKNKIILLILTILLIAGFIYYYSGNKNDSNVNTTSNNKNPVVLSETTDTQESSMYVDGEQTNSTKITEGQTYLNKITQIRKDINDGFDDLNQKVKYKTLFDEEDTMSSANALLDQLNLAKTQIQELNIDEKFSEANEEHIKSIDLLVETVEYFKKLYYAENQEDQQKYSDLYNYNIDESNKILENIVIPQ